MFSPLLWLISFCSTIDSQHETAPDACFTKPLHGERNLLRRPRNIECWEPMYFFLTHYNPNTNMHSQNPSHDENRRSIFALLGLTPYEPGNARWPVLFIYLFEAFPSFFRHLVFCFSFVWGSAFTWRGDELLYFWFYD